VPPRAWRRLYYSVRFPHRDVSTSTGLVSHEPRLFRRIIEDALARPSDRYLVLPVRSNALARASLARRVSANVDTLLALTRSRRLEWMTPAQAIGVLRPARSSP
jgi:hypothetical protein